MATVVQRTVVVQTGGRIELSADELPEGATAEVTIKVIEQPMPPRRLVDMVGTGSGLFKTPEEVDAYIREVRDWGER